MSDFLKKLKDAADNGEFNSEAAKKIIEIDKKANDFSETKTTNEMEESLNKKIEDSGVKSVSEEDVAKLNSEYEEKMKEHAKKEKILATIATLSNMDDDIEKIMNDLFLFIFKLKSNYDPEDKDCGELYEKIKELENKYKFNN